MTSSFKRAILEATGRRSVLLTKLWIFTESLKTAKQMQSRPYIKACKQGIFDVVRELRS